MAVSGCCAHLARPRRASPPRSRRTQRSGRKRDAHERVARARARAGSYGRALIDNDEASLGGVKGWQVALGMAVTLAALLYMGRLAQQALDEAEAEEGAAP